MKNKFNAPQTGVDVETTSSEGAGTNETFPTEQSTVANASESGTNAPMVSAEKPKNETVESAEAEVPTETLPKDAAFVEHAAEVAARQVQTIVEGGKEFVGAGFHKGREIKDGVIDFSTPSERELRKETVGSLSQPLEEKKAA